MHHQYNKNFRTIYIKWVLAGVMSTRLNRHSSIDTTLAVNSHHLHFMFHQQRQCLIAIQVLSDIKYRAN